MLPMPFCAVLNTLVIRGVRAKSPTTTAIKIVRFEGLVIALFKRSERELSSSYDRPMMYSVRKSSLILVAKLWAG